MTKDASAAGLPWQDLVLREAEIVALRLRGSLPGGLDVEIRDDLGTVIVTITDPGAQQVTSRILSRDQSVQLLEALRKQSQLTPRIKLVSASALHAFVSALAVSLYSSGPIPFGAASFGAVTHANDGQLVGKLAIDSQTDAIIIDTDGGLSYELHSAKHESGSARRMSAAQLRTFINALRIYLASNRATADPLWQQILADAINERSRA